MTEVRWLNDEEQKLWRLLLGAIRKVQNHNDRMLQTGHDLTSSEFAVLVSLSESSEQRMRLRDLCANLEWDRSRTSHQVTRMEKRGLVSKSRCMGDGRGTHISLTDEGRRRLIQAAPCHVELVREVIFDSIPPEFVEPLVACLETINSKVEVDGDSSAS